MKKNVIFFLLTLLSVSVYAGYEGDKVSRAIEDQFHKQFGTSVTVTWKIIEDVSVASYTENGQQREAFYLSDGELVGIGNAIEKQSVPVSVSESVAARFPQMSVLNAYEFKGADAPTRYILRIARKGKFLIVSANEFGDIEILRRNN
jgi:hypothetical protein